MLLCLRFWDICYFRFDNNIRLKTFFLVLFNKFLIKILSTTLEYLGMPDKLATWCGIVASAYQSTDKLLTGSITKQVSKHIRSILVQAAHAAVKKMGSKPRKILHSEQKPRKDIS